MTRKSRQTPVGVTAILVTDQLARTNPEVVPAGDPPVLIDERQRVPATWDAVRRAVDDGAAPGSAFGGGSDNQPEDASAKSEGIVGMSAINRIV